MFSPHPPLVVDLNKKLVFAVRALVLPNVFYVFENFLAISHYKFADYWPRVFPTPPHVGLGNEKNGMGGLGLALGVFRVTEDGMDGNLPICENLNSIIYIGA